ncbi:MAG: 50S ribosomal protein L7/L12 [Parcubacteria group bacterium 21-54-25]|nr:MAG: 50S ribosomal protein L7/L12 [Parcubacteria group bacterium 21-54-25]HQU07495.1 50S ribosomal protein L7/L12 [Candidatus Paceibacterota bacterium]
MSDEVKKEEEKATEAAAAPEVSAAAEEAEVEVPEQFKKLVETIETMTVLELSELVKVFEKKFGVSASAVAVAAPGATAAAGEEEKSMVTVELSEVGANKIAVIKAVKEVLVLGLKEAKDLVDGVPSVLKENVKKEDAEVLKSKIEAAGGKVTFK